MINIKRFTKDMQLPEVIPDGNWIDLRAAENVDMDSGDFKLIPLGIGMKLPEGYEAIVAPRSSTFGKYGIIMTNSIGIIDSSYCGNDDQWHFPAIAMRDTFIQKGDRIAQFRIIERQPILEFKEVENLDDKSRGGFGSTGVK